MKKIYQNFDKLEVTFQCAIPRYNLNKLAAAKEEASENRHCVYIKIGKSQIPVEVAENGMKGGFQYRFSTGLDGAIWAIADSENANLWNVRVSVSSLCLALYGYFETKNKILSFLIDELNAIPPKNYNEPLERVSRFDFCIDFLAENNFIPDPKCFLTHNRSKKKYQGDIPNIPPLDFIFIDQGKEIQTITIGKLPNRQITIYNKSREISVSKKSYWWDIWGINAKDKKPTIWRVEARAGKKELNKYNLRRFSDFEKKAGDVIINILKDYRYVIPNPNDKNRARWPIEPFWKTAIEATNNCLADYICNADRKEIIAGQREIILKRYRNHINGVLTSYAAAQGLDISELPTVLEGVNKDVLEDLRNNPQKFKKSYENAEKKFEFKNREIKIIPE